MGNRKGTLENMGVIPEFWAGRKVLVTGHTGFKGAWLCQWLVQMGAKVSGLSLAPEDEHCLWFALGLGQVSSHIGDIRDPAIVQSVMQAEQPDIVLHLAAQSLVRRSYREPAETFDTNVMGTIHVLNAVRAVKSVRAAVVITTDKCYRNDETGEAFAENDPMGGHDPYSASKGAAELATSAMRDSYFTPGAAMAHPARVASARAGNVIGGGDWAEDRIVPDIIRGCLEGSGEVVVRSPADRLRQGWCARRDRNGRPRVRHGARTTSRHRHSPGSAFRDRREPGGPAGGGSGLRRHPEV